MTSEDNKNMYMKWPMEAQLGLLATLCMHLAWPEQRDISKVVVTWRIE